MLLGLPLSRVWKGSNIGWVAWLGIILVSACGSPGRAVAQGAVPWIDSPGIPLVKLASGSTTSRACVARDIHVLVGAVGAYQGHQTQELTIQNIAPDACRLPAPPSVAVGLDNGQQLAVMPDASTSVLGASNGADALAVGGSIHLLIGTPGTCAGAGNPNISKVVRLSLSAAEVVTVSGTWINVECGDPVMLAFNLAQPAAPPVPTSSLRAKLTIPTSASPGAVLIYFVTLSNASSQVIVLDPCPSYTQTMGIGTPIRQTLLLNCASAGSMPVGGSSTFEMRFIVPASFPTGATKLSWQLEVPRGTFAGTAVTVA